MLRMLAQTDLFKALPREALLKLSRRGRKRTFLAGSTLLRQSEVSDVMYVILSGRVRVEHAHPAVIEPLVLAELGAGEVVGEMRLLDGEPRSATVIAVEDTQTLELSSEVVMKTLVEFPEVATALLKILSARIRRTDELAVQLLRKSANRRLHRSYGAG